MNRYSEYGNDAVAHFSYFYLISRILENNNLDQTNINSTLSENDEEYTPRLFTEQQDNISDENKDVLKSYGAWGVKKMYGREYEGIYRSTYIINEDGKIEKAFSKVTTKTHAKDVLAEL